MAAYVIVQLEITDPEGFAEYREKVGPQIEKHGGRYIVRGAEVENLEGELQDDQVEDHDGDAVFAVFGLDAILLSASQAKRDGNLIDLRSSGFAETIKVSQSTGFVELSTGPARAARLRASLRERMVNYIFGEGEYPEPQPNDLVAIRVESGVSQGRVD
ncbi:MAG: DUF1330 domain-containing protein [Chloroflexi bacterium]|nr:DUF1330 domain-containing protein [Chloroflexota bacterium]